MAISSNVHPKGQSCNTCRFALTHVEISENSVIRTIVRCARFPPVRVGLVPAKERMIPVDQRAGDSVWPYATVDDWCGEWKRRSTGREQIAAIPQ
jgi:hypothetical protein